MANWAATEQNFEYDIAMDQKISCVGADQLSIYIPIVREQAAHNQYPLLESCKSIILKLTGCAVVFCGRQHVTGRAPKPQAKVCAQGGG